MTGKKNMIKAAAAAAVVGRGPNSLNGAADGVLWTHGQTAASAVMLKAKKATSDISAFFQGTEITAADLHCGAEYILWCNATSAVYATYVGKKKKTKRSFENYIFRPKAGNEIEVFPSCLPTQVRARFASQISVPSAIQRTAKFQEVERLPTAPDENIFKFPTSEQTTHHDEFQEHNDEKGAANTQRLQLVPMWEEPKTVPLTDEEKWEVALFVSNHPEFVKACGDKSEDRTLPGDSWGKDALPAKFWHSLLQKPFGKGAGARTIPEALSSAVSGSNSVHTTPRLGVEFCCGFAGKATRHLHVDGFSVPAEELSDGNRVRAVLFTLPVNLGLTGENRPGLTEENRTTWLRKLHPAAVTTTLYTDTVRFTTQERADVDVEGEIEDGYGHEHLGFQKMVDIQCCARDPDRKAVLINRRLHSAAQLPAELMDEAAAEQSFKARSYKIVVTMWMGERCQ